MIKYIKIEYIKKIPKISVLSLLVSVLILFKFLLIGGVSVFIVSALAILGTVVITGNLKDIVDFDIPELIPNFKIKKANIQNKNYIKNLYKESLCL
jgi:hypothetical protein